jgi:membrane-bound lytic murein transglycosylase F
MITPSQNETAVLMSIHKIAKGFSSLALIALLSPLPLMPSSTAPRESYTHSSRITFLDERFAYLESFAHLEAMRYGGNKLFAQRIETRLPRYQGLMQSAAVEHDLDWHLIAAMSYQESFWNPEATSPTGVRGLMMLTLQTAKELSVTDRLDPRESIHGGTRYFAQLRNRLPASIAEPDRTWMALAAYNMGMSHLEDARVLTQHKGKNPNVWTDVKQTIPLLEDKRYYPYLRKGYARGNEAVAYVERIRQYHTILTWHHNIEQYDLAVVRDDERFAGALALMPRGAMLPPTSL